MTHPYLFVKPRVKERRVGGSGDVTVENSRVIGVFWRTSAMRKTSPPIFGENATFEKTNHRIGCIASKFEDSARRVKALFFIGAEIKKNRNLQLIVITLFC